LKDKAPKKVLCVDLGAVLIEFDGSPVEQLIKKEKRKRFTEQVIPRHDKDELHLWYLYKELVSGYFEEFVTFEKFVQAYASCIVKTHRPMFEALFQLRKENRARLVCTTDNNHFAFAQLALKCPEIFQLFKEGNGYQFVISYILHALKIDGSPFTRAGSEFGFAPSEGAVVDDRDYNLEAAVKVGFDKSACFLYKQGNKLNQKQFKKFLEKNFPKK